MPLHEPARNGYVGVVGKAGARLLFGKRMHQARGIGSPVRELPINFRQQLGLGEHTSAKRIEYSYEVRHVLVILVV